MLSLLMISMMRIDLLKTSPDRAGRYYVKFEDETSMRLYRQTVEDFGLYTGKELSDEEMKDTAEANEWLYYEDGALYDGNADELLEVS